MTVETEIRDSMPGDNAGIEVLYRHAFEDEDLVPLVQQVIGLGADVVSLVATRDDGIVGHISFTLCQVAGDGERVALLAPLAVLPEVQKQGIGSALIRAGFERLQTLDIDMVLVLGDPAYYGRFGFEAEQNVTTPYPLPEAWSGAWQSRRLSASNRHTEGRLIVPAPWQQKALWSP